MTGDDFDDFAADRLLDGGPDGPPALTRLLWAANAPGRSSELAGEEAALSAYRLVRSATPPVPVEEPLVGSILEPGRRYRPIIHHGPPRKRTRRAPVRLAIVGAALTTVAAIGGVAVASGVVPAGPLRNLVPIGPNDSSQNGTPGRTGNTGNGNGTPSTNGNSGGGPGTTTSPGTTPANLNGLCHSFQEAAAEDLPAALADKRFAVLVTLAGGSDHVASYCAKIIGDKNTKPEPSGSPAAPGPNAGQRGQ